MQKIKKKIIKRNYCTIVNCKKNARYGLIKNKPISCRIHKCDKYWDVISRLCNSLNCKKQPSFGYPKSSIKFCKLHSLPNMINLKNKICEYDNCKKRATYGLIKVTHCKTHAKNNMEQKIGLKK